MEQQARAVTGAMAQVVFMPMEVPQCFMAVAAAVAHI
jgi:hypothetical protein